MTNKIITTKLDIERLSEGVLSAISKPINRLTDRVKKLEEREFPYKGVHQRSTEYQRGMFVTYKGSMWHCCADKTRQQPGSGSDWQLAVKGSE